jgi:hypothetical protein
LALSGVLAVVALGTMLKLLGRAAFAGSEEDELNFFWYLSI